MAAIAAQLVRLRFASDEEAHNRVCLYFPLKTFFFQHVFLLFHKGILVFQRATFHSKLISMRESPGVSS